jgi:hypothetical protein
MDTSQALSGSLSGEQTVRIPVITCYVFILHSTLHELNLVYHSYDSDSPMSSLFVGFLFGYSSRRFKLKPVFYSISYRARSS